MFEGVADLALSVAPLVPALGVCDAEPLGESAALWDWPNFDVALDDGFRPVLVGVFGADGVFAAAGVGAILLDVRAV